MQSNRVNYFLHLCLMMASPIPPSDLEEEWALQQAIIDSLALDEDLKDAIRASMKSEVQASRGQLAPATSGEEQAQQV